MGPHSCFTGEFDCFAQGVTANSNNICTKRCETETVNAGQRAPVHASLAVVKDVVEQLTCKLIHASAGIALSVRLGSRVRAALCSAQPQPQRPARSDPSPGQGRYQWLSPSAMCVDEAAARSGSRPRNTFMHAVMTGTLQAQPQGQAMAQGGSGCKTVQAATDNVWTQTVAGKAAGLEAGLRQGGPKATASALSSRPFRSVVRAAVALRDTCSRSEGILITWVI